MRHNYSCSAPVTVNSFVYRFIQTDTENIADEYGNTYSWLFVGKEFLLQHFTAEYLAVVWRRRNLHKVTQRFMYVWEISSNQWLIIKENAIYFLLCTVATEGGHPQYDTSFFPCSKKLVLAIFSKKGLVFLVVNFEVKTEEQIVCGLISISNLYKLLNNYYI